MKKLDNIKIIFIDIDGTLTNSHRKVTEKTAESIKRVVSKGIKVVITSGRNYFYCINMSKKANASPIIISSDGSLIYDYEKNKIIYKNYINNDKLQKVYDYAMNKELGILMNSTTNSYCNSYVKNKENYDAKLIKQEDLNDIDICQIVLFSKLKETIKEVEEFIDKIDLQISYFSKSFLENINKDASIDIVNKNVSKGKSIEYLFKKLNISKEESLCIGDYNNDLDMFATCGFKVAMDNATKQIKDKANYITLSNDKDGVAYFLDNFI